jgi:hypothetical protein
MKGILPKEQLDRLPKEMRDRRQWVCAATSADKSKDKIPYNPNNMAFKADPTKPATWGTYTEALAARSKDKPHIGYVLSQNDPFTIVDLDDPYNNLREWTNEQREFYANLNSQLMEMLESYTELSQSGTGVHIIVKGSIPQGMNRDTVEMYSTQRYMICTGNVMKDLSVNECQEELDMIYDQMKVSTSTKVELDEGDELISDEEVIELATERFSSFIDLYNGIKHLGDSESDLELLGYLTRITENNEQVRRIYRGSGLCKCADKQKKRLVNDTYLNFTLRTARSSIIRQEADEARNEEVGKTVAAALLANFNKPKYVGIDLASDKDVTVTFSDEDTFEDEAVPCALYPPGLVGEIAEYIYQSSVRPVREVGLIASIGMMAGVVGRNYNISSTGLNQYLIFLAKTGTGKEGIASGIDRIFSAVRKNIPMCPMFRGPGAFASGPALVKTMSTKPVFLSILGEFGITLQQLCDPRANGAQVTLRHALLDLYQKSGWESTLSASVYSDKEKNTDDVQAPALSILGESTPETFLEGLSEHHIADGLIPRFTIVEYSGKRPYINKSHGAKPSEKLVSDITTLLEIVIQMHMNNQHVEVHITPEASKIADSFETETTDIINKSSGVVLTQLWNRAHLKVLKLAALIAVGCNHEQPIVTKEILEWSMAFVKRDILTLLKRFEKGEVGSGEDKQYSEVKKKISNYFKKKPSPKNKKFHDGGVIQNSVILQGCASASAFQKAQHGATKAIKATIETMIENGELTRLSKDEAKRKFDFNGSLYRLEASWND